MKLVIYHNNVIQRTVSSGHALNIGHQNFSQQKRDAFLTMENYQPMKTTISFQFPKQTYAGITSLRIARTRCKKSTKNTCRSCCKMIQWLLMQKWFPPQQRTVAKLMSFRPVAKFVDNIFFRSIFINILNFVIM